MVNPRDEKIPFAKPFLDREEAEAAKDVVLSGWVTQGPKVDQFETDFSRITDAAHSCAVSNCTVALSLALKAVGVGFGNVVVTVSHSFIATANAIRHCGAEPVFADIEPHSFNIDPDQVERILEEDCEERDDGLFYKEIPRLAVGESPLTFLDSSSIKNRGRVAALLPVHQYGMPCDMGRLLEIAKRYQIPVVEDAACALGSQISINRDSSWEPIGKPHGQIACFSFHPRKIITTGEGGMLTTGQLEQDKQFRLLRHHGMNIPDYKRHNSKAGVLESYLLTGFNFRMTDIQAAVGIEQLKKLSCIIENRRNCGQLYKKLLGEISWIQTQEEKARSRTNWQTFVCTLADDAPCDRFELMKTLGKRGIASRRSNVNAHEEPPYKPQGWKLPVSERVVRRGVALPMFAGLTEDKVLRCVQVIKEIYGS